MNFAAMISSLGGKQYTVTRQTPGDYDSQTGKYTPSGTSSSFTVTGLEAPMSGEELMIQPEGSREEEHLIFFTAAELKEDDEATETGGDTISIRGKVFEVIEVQVWQNAYRITLINQKRAETP